MDAREHFQNVVVRNYNEFIQSPTDFHLLENALLSMDLVPERLGLHNRGYAQVARKELYEEAKMIRDQSGSLDDLHFCANALKHVRTIRDHAGKFTTIATSTGIDPNDPTTWKIGEHDLVKVAHSAFVTLYTILTMEA
jgi:hypothetical protein